MSRYMLCHIKTCTKQTFLFHRSSEAEVKKLKSSMGLDAESDVALSMVSDNTQRLTSAVNSLPQLMEKKRLIDMHTTIATGITYNLTRFKIKNCRIYQKVK